MKLPLFLSAALISASPVFAQSSPFTHEGSSVTLAYNFHDDDNDDPYNENFTYSVTGTSRYSLSEKFGFDVTLGYNEETYEEDFFSRRFFLDLNPFYDTGAGRIGAFYTHIAHLESGESPETHSQYGITGSHSFGDFTFEAYAGRMDAGGTPTETVGVGVGYEVNDDFDVYFTERRDYQPDSTDYVGLVSIGASYDFGGLASNSVPITVAAELSRHTSDSTRLSDSDWEQVSIVATYKFGSGADSLFRGVRSYDFFYD